MSLELFQIVADQLMDQMYLFEAWLLYQAVKGLRRPPGFFYSCQVETGADRRLCLPNQPIRMIVLNISPLAQCHLSEHTLCFSNLPERGRLDVWFGT